VEIDNWLKIQDNKIKTYIEAYKTPKREPSELIDEINESWIYIDKPRLV